LAVYETKETGNITISMTVTRAQFSRNGQELRKRIPHKMQKQELLTTIGMY